MREIKFGIGLLLIISSAVVLQLYPDDFLMLLSALVCFISGIYMVLMAVLK